MEVGTGRALSAVILVTWTATPGETARARRGSKNSSVRGCEWAPQLLHSCVPSPGPAPFFFYLRSSFNILAERAPHAHTHTEGERERGMEGGRERENGRRQIFTRPASKSSLPSSPPWCTRRANFSSASFVVRGGTNTPSPRSRSRKAATRWNGGTANRFKRNRHLDIARMYYENVGRQFNRSGNIC